MTDITTNRIEEIKQLHTTVLQQVKQTLEIAIRIGELLIEQKHELEHGQFVPWLKSNLPFSVKTAQNYMKVYRNREELKNETVTFLGDAYKLLESPKPMTEKSLLREYKECVEEFNRYLIEGLKENDLDKEMIQSFWSKLMEYGLIGRDNSSFVIRLDGKLEDHWCKIGSYLRGGVEEVFNWIFKKYENPFPEIYSMAEQAYRNIPDKTPEGEKLRILFMVEKTAELSADLQWKEYNDFMEGRMTNEEKRKM